MKTKHPDISCIYCDETFGSYCEMDAHKLIAHNNKNITTKTQELLNDKLKVTAMKTEQDVNMKMLFFSEPTQNKYIKKINAVKFKKKTSKYRYEALQTSASTLVSQR